MFPASIKGGGISIFFPDVCKTPAGAGATPIPYPNIAKTASAAQKTKKTASTKVMTKGSTFSRSRGDAAGTLKGVASSKVQGEILGLKGMLNQLNGKLQRMTTSDPNEWQVVLQEYAVVASALYVTHNGS